MRIGKPLFIATSNAAAEIRHTLGMIEDFRDGNGHSTDLAKIKKSLTRAGEQMDEAIKIVNPKEEGGLGL
jgi:hypothetical protein